MRSFQVGNIAATTTGTSTPLLRKGQRWNMADQQLRIYRVGVHLVEFRVVKLQDGLSPKLKFGRSSLETVASVQNYLQKHQAVLGDD
jgi:hypothetical protein